ncbi:MAG: hypothetical protein V3W34_09065 [Phycisphaerae bacterium]
MQREGRLAKFWLEPVMLTKSKGLGGPGRLPSQGHPANPHSSLLRRLTPLPRW